MKVVTGRGHLRVGSSVGRDISAKVKYTLAGHLDKRSKLAQDLFAAAHLIALEAEREAIAHFGKSNIVTRGFTVQEDAKGFPIVTNIAVAPLSGQPIGGWWETGTGIYGPRKKVITPKSGQYMVFPTNGNAKYRRQRRNKKGQFGKSSTPALLKVRTIKGFKGGKFLQKGATNVARKHGWRYTPKVRF